MTEPSRLFTLPEVWRGGSYELYIEAWNSVQLGLLLRALWSHPLLKGCYRLRDCEPAEQMRVQAGEGELSGHLYGLATLPNGRVVACGSYVTDFNGEDTSSPFHFLSFGIELGSLATAYPVGGYPFGPSNEVANWKSEIETWFAETGKYVYGKVPFRMALIGFEVNPDEYSIRSIESSGVPTERNDGILWSDGSHLNWYPATRP